MHITPRDIELLRWINSHGAVDITHIAKYLSVSEKVAYRRMKKIADEDLVWHTRFYYDQPGVYRVSREGVRLSRDTLPAMRRLPKATLAHDLMVTTLSQHLMNEYPAKFVTERQLRQKQGVTGVGQSVHICDGELVMPDRKVAIEVELSLKGKARRESILNHYMTNFDYDEVWYFCRQGSVFNTMKKFESVSHLFKVSEIKSVLEEGEQEVRVA